jgi:hypothetical protein
MTTPDSLTAYDAALPPEQAAITQLLRRAFDAALPNATSKVWHRHPVWFIGENPVVGYNARPDAVHILFWNGQAFEEPGLDPVGKYRAAGTHYAAASDVKLPTLRRWLKKARTEVFDGVTYFQRLRDAAKARSRAAAKKKR